MAKCEAERICDICGVPLEEHPKCEACGILVGPGHVSGVLEEFRGHKICTDCRWYWQKLEKLEGKEVAWAKMGHITPQCLGVGIKKDEEKEDQRQGAEAE